MSWVRSEGGYLVCEKVSSLLSCSANIIVSDSTEDTPFKTLDVFSTNFVVQYMRHLIGGNLFSSGSFMNTKWNIKSCTKLNCVHELTQPSSLQWATEHSLLKAANMSRLPFGTVAFACNARSPLFWLTRREEGSGRTTH